MILRVTVDTNVLVSHFLVKGGNPSKVMELARQGRLKLVLSDAILDELERVLVAKMGYDRERATRARRSVADVAERVVPHHAVSAVKEDESDNRILECALSGRVQVLVSGDRHLLELKGYKQVRIMTPRNFLEEYPD